MEEQRRIEIAELMQILEINKKRLDQRQYKQLEEEINRRLNELRNE